MPTIKGPIHIKSGNFGKLMDDSNIKIKLPFTATGWKSSKSPCVVEGDIKITKDKPEAEKKVEEEKVEPIKKEEPKKTTKPKKVKKKTK